jgi:hypothetical protein
MKTRTRQGPAGHAMIGVIMAFASRPGAHSSEAKTDTRQEKQSKQKDAAFSRFRETPKRPGQDASRSPEREALDFSRLRINSHPSRAGRGRRERPP